MDFKCPDHPDARVLEDNNSQQRCCSVCCREVALLPQAHREELGLDSNKFHEDAPQPTDDGERWRAVLVPGTEGNFQQSATGGSQRQCMNLMKDISRRAKNPVLRKEGMRIVDAYMKYLHENEPEKAFITLHMAASAMYLASRKTENVELQLEVIKICKQHPLKVNLSVQFDIMRALNMDLRYLKPEDIVPVFCMKLSLNSGVEWTAIHVARAIKKLRRDIVKPSLLATIGIYIACQAHEEDQYRTSDQVAKALEVKKSSFLPIAQAMVAHTWDIFPSEFPPKCTALEYLKRETIFSFFL